MSSLKQFIRTYDGALKPDFCRLLIDVFNQNPKLQGRNGKSVRGGLANSNWTEMDIGRVSAPEVRQGLAENALYHKRKYEQDCAIVPPLPESGNFDRLIMKRYSMGTDEQFEAHYDAVGPVSNRYLVYLWYLNDVETGGETYFRDLDLRVKPVQGRLVIFPPYWMFLHEGCPPITEDKYILSSYSVW